VVQVITVPLLYVVDLYAGSVMYKTKFVVIELLYFNLDTCIIHLGLAYNPYIEHDK